MDGGDVQTIQRRSSRPMFREKRSGMCLRSTFWLSFEAMLEMALLVMSPYFSLCYVRVLVPCVKSKPMCARSHECVYGENALAVVCFSCAQKEKYLVNHSCFSSSRPLGSRYWPLQRTNTHSCGKYFLVL